MEVKDVKFYLRKRYLVAFLIFLSWIFLHLMRTNLSITIVDMTSAKLVTVGNESTVKAEFDWSSKERGLVLGVFSWGLMTAPLAAVVANKCGPVVTFGIGLTLTAVLTFFTPFFLSQGLIVYLIARTCEGIFEGLAASTFVDILKIWSSPSERTRTIATARCGLMVGTVLGFPICGTIVYYVNWKAVFYITGGASLIWSILWFTFIKNYPEGDRLMCSQERKYLEQVNGTTSKLKVDDPWRKILTSKAVWAYLNNRFVEAVVAGFLNNSLPLFIKDAHNVNIQEIGFLSSIPHAAGAVGLISGSFLADYLRSNRILSIHNVHRVFICFGQSLGMTVLIALSVVGSFSSAVVCLAILGSLTSINLISFDILPVDMGGRYSCFIMACGLSFTGVGVFLSPVLMGLIVTKNSMSQWSFYFLIMGCLQLWGAIIFYIFGSGELQPWAVPVNDTDKFDQKSEKELKSIEIIAK